MRRLLLPLAALAAFTPARGDPGTSPRILLLRGETEAAWRAAADELADSPHPVRATVDLVTAAALLDRTEESLARVRAREERDPGRRLPELADGVAARLARRHADAEAKLTEVLSRLESRRDPETVVAREDLAFARQDAGQWRDALRLHERNARNSDPLVALAATYGIAYCSLQAKEYTRADSLLRRVVDETRRLDLPLWLGDAEALRATLRWIELDTDGLLAALTRAYEAYEIAGRPSRQASCLRRMAATNLSRGEVPLALKRLHRARNVALEAGDLREASFCLEHLGSASRDLGDEEAALSQWRAALEEGGTTWPPDWRAGTLQNIGTVEARRGDFEAALGSFARALDELRRTEGRFTEPSLLHRIALCLEMSGREEQALERLEQAVTLARSLELAPAEAAALVDQGELFVTNGRTRDADRVLRRAEELVAGSNVPSLEIAVHAGWAALRRAEGNPVAALERLERAMDLAETVRLRSRNATSVRERAFGRHGRLWSRAIGVLDDLQRQTGDPAHARRAFDVAQRAKARSFLDLLAESPLRLRSHAGSAVRERERRLLEELARLDARASRGRVTHATLRQLQQLEEELAILESEMREADPRWKELGSPPLVSAAEAVSLVELDEIVLEYWLAEEASWLWIITPGSLRMERLPGRNDIERDVRQLLPLLSDYNLLGADPSYFLPPARRLSRMLLGPVSETLTRAARVTVVPHGVLHYLPFEVLLTDEVTSEARFADLPWLVERVDVSYLPALSLRRRLTSSRGTRDPRETELLLIGDAVPGEDVAPLLAPAFDGSVPSRASFAQEVTGLAESWNSGPVRRAVRMDATVTALRGIVPPRTRRLIHFTAHGVLNERRPRLSGILLTPDPALDDDGFLSVDEVFALDLPCEQVVLSACSTALGRAVTGEGLVGLTRAFFYAGARSVVASLWEVPSEPTTRLMLDFYRRLVPGRARARALAEAKRAAIRAGKSPHTPDPAHPCLWAGFVMIGDDA